LNQNTTTPTIDDVVWAELLSAPSLKRLKRNERVIDSFALHGWITHTSRRDEFSITESGRSIAERRLPDVWPSWREDLASFAILGLSPEDVGAWSLLRRAQANQVPRTLAHINRRTLNAWERRHSKVGLKPPSEPFATAQITIDEVARLRMPPGSRILLHDGKTLDCDSLMATFGEVAIPERAWEHIREMDAAGAKAVISIENKGAYVDFPIVPQATLLFLPGDNTSILRQVSSRMAGQPVIHFGDLDPAGIEIFETLLVEKFPVHHFVPSYVEEFVLTHAQPCKKPWPERDYSNFHPVISKLASKGFWLEHEALVLDHRFGAELEALIRKIHEL
jgi:hypothetical protein